MTRFLFHNADPDRIADALERMVTGRPPRTRSRRRSRNPGRRLASQPSIFTQLLRDSRQAAAREIARQLFGDTASASDRRISGIGRASSTLPSVYRNSRGQMYSLLAQILQQGMRNL